LGEWLYVSGRPRPFDEAIQWAQTLRNIMDPKETFARLQKRKVGAPNKYRTYTDVFEFMLQGPDVSLGQARHRFNPPLPKESEPSLKAGIRLLKKLLRVEAPELLAEYESLHPDKARKVNG
jgi:hypothetical protein